MNMAKKKVEIKNLILVFGKQKRQALELLEAGSSIQDVREKTKCAVGVNDVSLDINEGEMFVIVGLSGSGKSSLIRCINLLNRPTKGQVLVDGEDI
jgi:glycine betaine/proline transport system ATP-binding protein